MDAHPSSAMKCLRVYLQLTGMLLSSITRECFRPPQAHPSLLSATGKTLLRTSVARRFPGTVVPASTGGGRRASLIWRIKTGQKCSLISPTPGLLRRPGPFSFTLPDLLTYASSTRLPSATTSCTSYMHSIPTLYTGTQAGRNGTTGLSSLSVQAWIHCYLCRQAAETERREILQPRAGPDDLPDTQAHGGARPVPGRTHPAYPYSRQGASYPEAMFPPSMSAAVSSEDLQPARPDGWICMPEHRASLAIPCSKDSRPFCHLWPMSALTVTRARGNADKRSRRPNISYLIGLMCTIQARSTNAGQPGRCLLAHSRPMYQLRRHTQTNMRAGHWYSNASDLDAQAHYTRGCQFPRTSCVPGQARGCTPVQSYPFPIEGSFFLEKRRCHECLYTRRLTASENGSTVALSLYATQYRDWLLRHAAILYSSPDCSCSQ